MFCSGCDQSPWNNPYPEQDSAKRIYYDSFSERPKHLDPVSSYSSNEYVFLGQIYEPPLQYHYLKRPYTLVPLAATDIPQPRYYSVEGKELPVGADISEIDYTLYDIHIQPDISTVLLSVPS